MSDQDQSDNNQESSPLNSFGVVILFMLIGAIGFGVANEDTEWFFLGAIYGLLGLAWLILFLSAISNRKSDDINPKLDNPLGRWVSLIVFTAVLIFAFMEF